MSLLNPLITSNFNTMTPFENALAKQLEQRLKSFADSIESSLEYEDEDKVREEQNALNLMRRLILNSYEASGQQPPPRIELVLIDFLRLDFAMSDYLDAGATEERKQRILDTCKSIIVKYQ